MKKICVYCGSNLGKSLAYLETAVKLGELLVKRNITLVYGGASIGIMGAVADTVLAGGGEVIGVIPKALVEKEVSHKGLTELKVVDSMHERKAAMLDLSDGFIALPGGLGTLEELFEVLTWSQLGLHSRPCGIINVEGFFDHLIEFLDHAVGQKYIKGAHRDMLLVRDDPNELLDAYENYQHPTVNKWIAETDT